MEKTIDLEQAIQNLSDENPTVREKAILELISAGDSRAFEFIVPLLKDPDITVRSKATGALSFFQEERALPLIIEMLKDEELLVRWCAVRGLQEIGDASVLPLLEEILRQNDTTKPFAATTPESVALRAEIAIEVIQDRLNGIVKPSHILQSEIYTKSLSKFSSNRKEL